MKSKFDICDEANRRFKELIDENKKHYLEKFRHLPYWLDDVSYYFSLESNDKLPKNYYYFKRGAVIRVNFGVNEGSEFSNIHFAIVLDKKDSKYKKTLTVLPLTSKQKKWRYSLGKELFNQTTTVLVKNVNDQQVALLKIEEERKEYQKKSNEIDIRIAILQNKVDNVNQEIDQLEKEYANKGRIDEFSEKQERIEKRRQEILKEISSLQEAQRLNNKLAQRIGNEVAQRQTELDQLQKVISIYQKYNKNSYVRLSDITTISKLRIERINKFDPSGKIRLTSEQMKGISDQLMKLYISN